MAFTSTFNGDVVRTNYVLPELVAKSIFIPNLTIPYDMVVSGESAYWKEFQSAEANYGDYGAKLSETKAGFKKYDIPLTKAVQLYNMMTSDQIRANQEGAVEHCARAMAAKAARKHNIEGLKVMVNDTNATKLTDTKALTVDTVFSAIVDAQAKYIQDNADRGDVPAAVLVSPATKALLIKALGEKAFTSGSTDIIYNGYIGQLAGLAVLEVVELATADPTVEFIMLGSNSFLAPYDVNEIDLVDKINLQPGAKALQSEMPCGFMVTKKSRVLVKKNA